MPPGPGPVGHRAVAARGRRPRPEGELTRPRAESRGRGTPNYIEINKEERTKFIMQKISYDDKCLGDWIKDNEWAAYSDSFAAAQTMLEKRSGPGNNFLGWLDLPATIDAAVVKKVRDTADALRPKTEVLICIGIGGSYLGARAAIEFVSPSFEDLRKPRVIFAGHQINSDYITDLLELVKDKNVAVNVISKSGTTTEPGIAFRIIKQWMEKRYGKKEAAERIVATTDPAKGALHRLAIEEKYATFDIPSDVGGRFSVLTPVGLFPCAMAGLDVAKLLAGAKEATALAPRSVRPR